MSRKNIKKNNFDVETGRNKTRREGAKYFYDDMVRQGKALAVLGLSTKEMAEFWGVGQKTLRRWMLRNPDFRKEIDIAQARADTNVTRSLYKKALGYTYYERKYALDNDGKKRLIEEKERQALPDLGAIIWWLKNRQPDKWREQIDTKLSSDEREVNISFKLKDKKRKGIKAKVRSTKNLSGGKKQ